MTAEQLLDALRPHLKRGENRLVVEAAGLERIVRESLASKSAPELYEMVRHIAVVMEAVAQAPGADTAVTQLRTGLMEPVLAAVVQRGKAENTERKVKASKKEKPVPMDWPTAGGARIRKRK